MVTHPVKQNGTALFAAIGTNTWLVPENAATECAVPAGSGAFTLPEVAGTAGVFNVGTRWSKLRLSASITSSVAAPCETLTGAVAAVPRGERAGVIAFGARLLPDEA